MLRNDKPLLAEVLACTSISGLAFVDSTHARPAGLGFLARRAIAEVQEPRKWEEFHVQIEIVYPRTQVNMIDDVNFLHRS